MEKIYKRSSMVLVFLAMLLGITALASVSVAQSTSTSTECCKVFTNFDSETKLTNEANFLDVNANTDYAQSIFWAYKKGIIKGYGNGNFGPDNCVLRSELVKMVIEYAENHPMYETIGAAFPQLNFKDVKTADWFYNYLKEAKGKGYISGYDDNTFRPNICVNRVEAMKIVRNVLVPNAPLTFSDGPVIYGNAVATDLVPTAWYTPYARPLFKYQLVGLDHAKNQPDFINKFKFYPAEAMSRKEVVEMLHRISVAVVQANSDSTKPFLNSPINDPEFKQPIDDGSGLINFNWSSVPGTVSYELRIFSTDSTAGPIDASGIPGPFFNDTGLKTSYQFPVQDLEALVNQNTYYWEVKAIDAQGNGTYSERNYFAVSTNKTDRLRGPILNSPYNGQILTSKEANVNFTWDKQELVAYYDFTIRLQDSEDNLLVKRLSTNSFNYTLPNTNQGYYWDVKAYDDQGKVAYSSQNYLMIGDLETPVLISPPNNAQFFTVNGVLPRIDLKWKHTLGTAKYDIMYKFAIGEGGYYNTDSMSIYTAEGPELYSPLPTDFPGFPLPTKEGYPVSWKIRAYDTQGNYKDSEERLLTLVKKD